MAARTQKPHVEESANKRFSTLRTALSIGGLIGLFVLTVIVTGQKDASELSKGLLQFIFFVAAAWLAIDLGRQSFRQGAADLLRPHGTKAVRRIVRLGRGIGGFSGTIDTQQDLMRQRANLGGGKVDLFEVEGAFSLLEEQVAEQLGIVEDAIEDWRDVVPDEVEEIETRPKEATQDGQ